MTENKSLEKLKTVILVVLFITTILLLYCLWYSEDGPQRFMGFVVKEQAVSVPLPGDVIRPAYAASGSGDGGFRICRTGLEGCTERFYSILNEFYGQGAPEIGEISPEQYKEAMTGWDSIQLDYGCPLPYAAVCRYECPDFLGAAEQLMMQIIGFSSASAESVFLADGSGRYYRLVFAEPVDAAGIAPELAEGSVSYYAADVLGGTSIAQIDLFYESDAARTSYVSEAAPAGEDYWTSAAEEIFGSNFDFVRRIGDGFGNITYMYGYGQKTLYLDAGGSLQYSAQAEEGAQTDFITDLEAALGFAARCGGLDPEKDPLRISSYTESGSGRSRVRTFGLDQFCGDLPIRTDGTPALQIGVCGGTVVSFRRDMADPGTPARSDMAPAIDAANVIAGNCHHIYNIINRNTLAVAGDQAFGFAQEQAKEIFPGYYRSEKDMELLPCWVLETRSGVTFFFDLYTGSPLGFKR